MTPIQLLRDMQAAHSARTAYSEARKRMHSEWKALHKQGFESWAGQVWMFEMIAERAYRAERDDPEPKNA
jgi:hypothetical protein